MKSILGYSDKISARAGETVAFKVSCEQGGSFDAAIVQLIMGDSHPDGPGFKERPVATQVDGSYQGKKQEILAGSYAIVPDSPLFALEAFTVQAMIWPTTVKKGPQTLVARWDESKRAGFILGIDGEGALALTLGDGAGKVETLSSGKTLVDREWYLVAAAVDPAKKQVSLYQLPLMEHALVDDSAAVTKPLGVTPGKIAAPLVMAATVTGTLGARLRTADHYNGKIDSPALSAGALPIEAIRQVLTGPLPRSVGISVIGKWDFSRDIKGTVISDVSPNRLHGDTINTPVRAMKGWNWTGEEMRWTHAPEQYGAIHFHDDDLYDSGWDTDFTFTVPEGLKSGLYAARVRQGEHEDYMPFVVLPPRGKATAKIAFLVATASYMAYANEHMPTDAPLAELLTGQVTVLYPNDVFLMHNRQYGGSCYDVHSDGSGICYTSRLRPILNMRPKYQSWLGGHGSQLWQFNADSHVIDWLDAKGFEYDCITDEDLHREGLALLEGYEVVITGTHPEYWSLQAWDALDAFKKRGGRLAYLGANGFYWRVAFHETLPGLMEVRRAEGGIRAWAAEPGEYYHSFTGEYGGLWRRNARPPQVMGGVGFTTQGFDISSYYRRKPDSYDPRAAFIFDGVSDEILGDFGLIGGGASGLELDRADRLLGTPPNALVLASSENHTAIYMVVLEELLINYPGAHGPDSDLVRADLVFYEIAGGGAVFATGSIAWAGSLSHNGYDNNISKITENVIRRFIDPTPFA